MPKDIGSLIENLKSGNWKIQREISNVLVGIGKPAVDLLVTSLGDESSGLRREAAKILGKIRDPRAIKPLIDALGEDRWGQSEIVEALAAMAQPAVGPLIAASKDEKPNVRGGAAKALGIIGDVKASDSLIIILKDSDKEVRLQAAIALGKLGDPKGTEPLVAVLKDGDASVRKHAVVALGEIGKSEAVEPLIEILKDHDGSVRRAGVEALDKLGWEPTNDYEKILYNIASDAWRELIEMDKVAAQPLIQLLNSKDEEQCHRAATCLGKIGDVEAFDRLFERPD